MTILNFAHHRPDVQIGGVDGVGIGGGGQRGDTPVPVGQITGHDAFQQRRFTGGHIAPGAQLPESPCGTLFRGGVQEEFPGCLRKTWFNGYTRDEAIGIMHLAASYCNAGRPANLNTFGGTTTASLPDRIWNKAKSIGNELWKDGSSIDENVPAGFRVLYVKIGSYQDMVCGYMNLGKLKLIKSFEGSSLTEGNRCYSKAGITFTVYDTDTNANIGSFTTDKDGKVSPAEIEIDEGTYKVVESHSKIGYTGNGDSKIVKVEAGKTAVVSFSDKSIVNPVNLLLSKVDDGTGKGYPQGAATLEGAEFTVKYYDGYYSSQEEAEKGGAAKKTWIFKTDPTMGGYLNYRRTQKNRQPSGRR